MKYLMTLILFVSTLSFGGNDCQSFVSENIGKLPLNLEKTPMNLHGTVESLSCGDTYSGTFKDTMFFHITVPTEVIINGLATFL